ncbi:hypothetical protein TgHK011_005528 [Trichoderma gracile]|nr:hypothetical protein TgHK011_005528 [Trichoderma gracile]
MFLLVFSRRHYQLACAPQAGAHERGFDLWQTIVMAGAAPQGPVAPSFWRPTTGRFDATHCLDAFSAPPSAAVPPPVPARGPGQLSATTRSTTDGQLRFYSLLREAACVIATSTSLDLAVNYIAVKGPSAARQCLCARLPGHDTCCCLCFARDGRARLAGITSLTATSAAEERRPFPLAIRQMGAAARPLMCPCPAEAAHAHADCHGELSWAIDDKLRPGYPNAKVTLQGVCVEDQPLFPIGASPLLHPQAAAGGGGVDCITDPTETSPSDSQWCLSWKCIYYAQCVRFSLVNLLAPFQVYLILPLSLPLYPSSSSSSPTIYFRSQTKRRVTSRTFTSYTRRRPPIPGIALIWQPLLGQPPFHPLHPELRASIILTSTLAASKVQFGRF